MEKITIIIPVYNVEKYIKDAVESAINQTYRNLEIILVDDGSKDNSGKICEEYAESDKRIKVVHQENKGLSGARNVGLSLATGDYIMFMDSDDFFELNACEILYNAMKEYDADYIVANYINVDENGEKWDKPVFNERKYHKCKISVDEPINSFYLMNSGVWNKIYKKSFLDFLELKFVERLPAEDAIFTTYCFIMAQNVYYIPDVIYDYRQRDSDSISTNCSQEYFLGINRAYKIIYRNFERNDKLEFYRYYYAKSMNYILYKFIDTNKLTKEQKTIVLDEMRWFYELAYELNTPTILKSVQYIVESIASKNYVQALKYCEILEQIRKMLPKEIKEKMSKPNEETYKEIQENIIDVELIKTEKKLLKKMRKDNINILSIKDSIMKLKGTQKSIARFGDGELALIIGKNLKFQDYNPEISKRLLEVLNDKQDFCLIGLPDALNGFNNLTPESKKFWINNMDKTYDIWMKNINKNMEFCNANLTRLYIRYNDKSECLENFELIKQLWEDRDVVICEGEQTRLGIGNDLLENCKSVKRILCPAEDAFEKYDEILSRVKKEEKNKLIMIALGPTATILAYDLAKLGYQALDLGHIDIEYEWFKSNANQKKKIQNKYTNEVAGGNKTDNFVNSEYKNQIDTIIT